VIFSIDLWNGIVRLKRNEAKAALEVLITMLSDANLASVDENIRSCFRDEDDWQFKEEIAEPQARAT
jgi:hypothetical protein